jgi:hypothetical protein
MRDERTCMQLNYNTSRHAYDSLESCIRITIESQLSSTTLEDNTCYSLENDVSAVVSFQPEVKSDGSTISEL